MPEPSERVLRWAAAALGTRARVVGIRSLRDDDGPRLLRIEHQGGTTEAVLKAGPTEWRELVTEAAGLAFAAEHNLAAPRLIAADVDGDSGALAVLFTLLPGDSRIPHVASVERLRALGAAAAALHAVPLAPRPDLPLRTRHIPWSDWSAERLARRQPTTPLLDTGDRWLQSAPTPAGETVFVHGDLWQGNVLWTGESYVGIVDWEASGAGHPGVDVGCLRLDAAMMYGLPSAAEVLTGWERASGRTAEAVAYWDVVAALNTPADMAEFVAEKHTHGRPDLDARTLTDRRDAFLRAAFEEVEFGSRT